jgi:hypothetical protein
LKTEELRYRELQEDGEIKYRQWKTVEAKLRGKIMAQERIILETQKAAIEAERTLSVHLIHCKKKTLNDKKEVVSAFVVEKINWFE